MIAAVDNTFLTLILNPDASPCPNPATGLPTEHCREKIDSLIDDTSRRGGRLIIPAPALAEALCAAEVRSDFLDQLTAFSCIEVAGFDLRAAYEFSDVIKKARGGGDKRSGVEGKWQHLKMDRAIVAIARVHGASVFYTDDAPQAEFARLAGMRVVHTWELKLSPERAQKHMQEGGQPWPEQKRTTNSMSSSGSPEPSAPTSPTTP